MAVEYWVGDQTGRLPLRRFCVSRSFDLADQAAVGYQQAHPACTVVIETWQDGVLQESHRTIAWRPPGVADESPIIGDLSEEKER